MSEPLSSLRKSPPASPAADSLLRIGALAKKVGKTNRALRLYEEMGLLWPSSRSSGGFRLYGDDAVDQVRWIGHLQEIGLSLQDIQALVDDVQQQGVPRSAMGDVRARLQERLDDIQAQIGRLNVLKRDLQAALTFLDVCNGCGVETDGAKACLSCGSQNANTPPLVRGIARCAAHRIADDDATTALSLEEKA